MSQAPVVAYHVLAMNVDRSAKCHIPLWLAGYDNRLRLLGVSTVAGNQTVGKVTLNALGLLTAAGLHSTRESSEGTQQQHAWLQNPKHPSVAAWHTLGTGSIHCLSLSLVSCSMEEIHRQTIDACSNRLPC